MRHAADICAARCLSEWNDLRKERANRYDGHVPTSFEDQLLKPTNAAKRLGIYLPAAPLEFQTTPITRGQLEELDKNPPAWLVELRANGPHPRPVVAGRLGISISGLARGGVNEALTTAEINELRTNPPQWLKAERQVALQLRSNAANLPGTKPTNQ